MLARLIRHRAWVVLIALVAGVAVAGSIGARMLWEPTQAHDARTVTCWNGDDKPRTECGRPTGVSGLEWVFPSLDAHSPACRQVPHHSTPTQPAAYEWRCTERLDGQQVFLTYTARTTLDRGRSYIASQFPGVTPVTSAQTKLTLWRPAHRIDGRWRLIEGYRDYPFTVTVDAASRSVRDRALTRLVRLRPAPYVVVRPAAA